MTFSTGPSTSPARGSATGRLEDDRRPAVPGPTPLRQQHADSIKFARGEGIWYDSGRVYLATTTDETIHVYDTTAKTLDVLYRAGDLPGTPLTEVDNVLVTKSGDLMVAETPTATPRTRWT